MADDDPPRPALVSSPRADERIARVVETLRRAVARACPAELDGMREDLVQAALVRFLERPPESGEVRSASYLWRIAYSVAIDELRRLQRKPVLLVEADAELPARSDLAVELNDCLDQLSEPRRLAVGLHLQGFTDQEAAQALGWNFKRVRNLIFRGMVDLRRCLQGKERR